ncbi:MAG: hydroxymethylglutaryl-CoA reductase, degradative [Anaerolineales bacterium]
MLKNRSSRLPGFYKLSVEERLEAVQQQCGLTSEEVAILTGALGLNAERAAHMIENVVGLYALPLGIATNFVVNATEVLVPMVIEEPSVVAGASLAAKLARKGGGYSADSDPPVMIGQIQVVELDDPWATRSTLLAHHEELLEMANEVDPVLVELGGGAREIDARVLEETAAGPLLVVHLLYDVRDAMGANAINSACERLAPEIERLTGGRVFLRILSNLADRRLARAGVSIPEEALAFGEYGGTEVAQGIEQAWAFAAADPYRATTHNKGIMNGIDAVVVATGNDWRAIEAGAHAYAARSGRYTSLSTWQRDGAGHLAGSLELPLALGTVGGATRVHPVARVALKILGVETARELAEVVAAVGLAQNFAALRALATEGIQRGHMSLHARQVAIAAGATGQEIDRIAEALVASGNIRLDVAQALLERD